MQIRRQTRQLFLVSRIKGIEELKQDVLVAYKSKANLKARPRVRFEEEEGAGSGPVREFFLTAMKELATPASPSFFRSRERPQVAFTQLIPETCRGIQSSWSHHRAQRCMVFRQP